jgi:hypothetical protein
LDEEEEGGELEGDDDILENVENPMNKKKEKKRKAEVIDVINEKEENGGHKVCMHV